MWVDNRISNGWIVLTKTVIFRCFSLVSGDGWSWALVWSGKTMHIGIIWTRHHGVVIVAKHKDHVYGTAIGQQKSSSQSSVEIIQILIETYNHNRSRSFVNTADANMRCICTWNTLYRRSHFDIKYSCVDVVGVHREFPNSEMLITHAKSSLPTRTGLSSFISWMSVTR